MLIQANEEPELIIEHYFKTVEFTYFALTVPFSYYDQIIYLENLDDRLKQHENIYYHREVLTRSTLGFDVHVLSLSEEEGYSDESEDQIH